MSGVTTDSDPTPGPRSGDIAEPINQLDAIRESCVEAGTRYVAEPSDERYMEFALGLDDHARAMRGVFAYILADDSLGNEEKALFVMSLYVDEDRQKVNMLNSFGLPGVEFELTSESQIARLQEYVLIMLGEDDNASSIAEEIVGEYVDDAEGNIRLLKFAVDQSKKAKMLRIRKRLGKDAIDVGKVVAGVIIGMSILKRIQKK